MCHVVIGNYYALVLLQFHAISATSRLHIMLLSIYTIMYLNVRIKIQKSFETKIKYMQEVIGPIDEAVICGR